MTTGVNWHKTREQWSARIYRGGKRYELGYYFTEEEAIAARHKAENIMNTIQPKVTQAERDREKLLKQINKRSLLPDFR